jgi:nitrile hydratase beta subunit
MNTIHDMGGMAGLGELDYEQNEPVFHHEWEGRAIAIISALGLFRRTELESIPAADYLRMSYYERWMVMAENLLVARGYATREEIETGVPAAGFVRGTPDLTAAEASQRAFTTNRSERDLDLTPRFAVGDAVRGRNMHPTTHTRMPRYTRGRAGVVERDRGVFDLPDNTELGLDPKPQHVYLVRFTARELWGDQAPAQDALYIDLWEDYLEPA